MQGYSRYSPGFFCRAPKLSGREVAAILRRSRARLHPVGPDFVLDGQPMLRIQPLVRALLLTLAGTLVLACAGSPSTRTGSRSDSGVLVALRNFKSGERFELAGESHTDRVEYYSGVRGDAARKVQTDEIMSALLGELERLGFDAHARPGRAPAIDTSEVIRWGLDVVGPTGDRHWLIGTGSTPTDWKDFQKCRDTFLQLYNITVSYQTVQNTEGKQFFEDPARTATGQKSPR